MIFRFIIYTALLLPIYTSAQQFAVSFDEKIFHKPFSGSVVIYLSKTEREPRLREQWTLLPVVFGAELKKIQPNETRILYDQNVTGYPVKPTEIERGT